MIADAACTRATKGRGGSPTVGGSEEPRSKDLAPLVALVLGCRSYGGEEDRQNAQLVRLLLRKTMVTRTWLDVS